jgi:hypothetical protein
VLYLSTLQKTVLMVSNQLSHILTTSPVTGHKMAGSAGKKNETRDL